MKKWNKEKKGKRMKNLNTIEKGKAKVKIFKKNKTKEKNLKMMIISFD